METVGERLKEERVRLGLNQQAVAEFASMARTAQIRYEKGERAPDTTYLAALADVGFDVQYIVTGVPSVRMHGLEKDLLTRFRAASPELQAAALAVLGTQGLATPRPEVQVVGGQHGQVLTGDVHQSGVTIKVGPKKRGRRG